MNLKIIILQMFLADIKYYKVTSNLVDTINLFMVQRLFSTPSSNSDQYFCDKLEPL